MDQNGPFAEKPFEVGGSVHQMIVVLYCLNGTRIASGVAAQSRLDLCPCARKR